MKPTLLLLAIFMSSCCLLKNNKTEPKNEEVLMDNTPKIIFVNYKILKTSDNIIQAELINKIIAKGSIKERDHNPEANNKGDIICIQLDNNSASLKSMQMLNPLIKNIEYVEPSGSLNTKQVELESADLSIRMQLHPEAKYISLQILDAPNIELLKIEL